MASFVVGESPLKGGGFLFNTPVSLQVTRVGRCGKESVLSNLSIRVFRLLFVPSQE